MTAQHGDVVLRYTERPDRLTGERVAHNLRFARDGSVTEVALPEASR